MKRKLALAKTSSPLPTRSGPKGLLTDLRELIVSARQSVATTVNAALTLLHWQVGKRIREDSPRNFRRAAAAASFPSMSGLNYQFTLLPLPGLRSF